MSIADAISRALKFSQQNSRTLIGICGEPGVGKSTFSHYLKQKLGESTVVLPMDGFHLSNTVLHALGRSDRKGAPDTFDVSGFSHLLKRVRNEVNQNIYFPIFHREIEESVASEGVISPEDRLIIVEGNYLLLLDSSWKEVASHLDEIWALTIKDDLRMARLIERHITHGKSALDARKWAHGSDQENAELIQSWLSSANFMVDLTDWNPEQRIDR